MIEQNEEKFIKVGDKAVKVEGFNESGIPIIKCESEEIIHPDGRKDIIIKVPCLTIAGGQKEI